MKYRSIKKQVAAQKVNMGGILLDQAIPLKGMDQIDPFLLIHHWSDALPGGKLQKDSGVGPHPHRGFTPVTFIFKGGVHHRDSTGVSGVISAGGTQWMHSGKGIVHSERPAKELAENGGDFEIIQFWVNVPAAKKMVEPLYQPLPAEKTPWIKSEDGLVTAGLVAGSFNGKKGPIKTETELFIMRLELEAGGTMEFPIPEKNNALLYMLDGDLTVNDDTTIGDKKLLWFENDGAGIKLKANAKSRAILLTGEPIGEPTVSYGPFVMNTESEIMQAMRDYQTGKMGHLNEQFN